mgnify:CR=1 FL=1
MKNSSNKVLYLAQAAMIAAIYVVLTVVGASLAFGEVQIRFAEALTILPETHLEVQSCLTLSSVALQH